MISYEIERYTPSGIPINVFLPKDILSCTLAYGDLAIGAMRLTIPASGYKPTDFAKDQLLEVYRVIDGVKRLEGQRFWRIRGRQWATDGLGRETITLTAYDGNYTLDNAIIAYYANSAFTMKTDNADDMLKALVNENMGAGCKLYSDGTTADTARINANLTVQADASLAPSISKQFAWENLKANLDEICEDSRQLGTWLTYDMVRTGRGLYEFRTYTGQRGNDYTGSNRKVLSKDFRNLINPVLTFDDENERNYAYVCGTGLENARTVVIVSDTDRINESIWNRREMNVNAAYLSDGVTEAYLTAQGNSAIYEKRPKISLNGEIAERENFRYGIDFDYGDKLIAQYQGYSFDVQVDKIKIEISGNGSQFENLQIKVSGKL